MYQALYRKYRPQNFNDVVGQEVIVKTLKNAVKMSKLSHAYLFTGPRGTGKTSIAKIFAKIVNCTNLKDLMPCDQCESCVEINKKHSIDIIEIDAASNNGVDEIREIKSKVNLVPSISKYKIYIIDEVHMLTTGAFNALLKTLEEPPSHVIFILATTEPHKIPATILSRCQRFDFKKISEQKIYENLLKITKNENISIDEEAILEIARVSDGGMRDAISLLDEAIAYSGENITVDDIHEINGTLTISELNLFIEYLLNNEIESLISKIEEYNYKGKNFVKLTEEIINHLKNILLSIVAPNCLEGNIDKYKTIKTKIDKELLINLIENFNNSINDMKKGSNSKLIFEIQILKIINVKNTQTISDIEIKQAQKIKENKEEIVKKEIKKEETKEEIKEDTKKEIKEENKTKKKNIVVNEKINLKLEEIKKIRINNTLAKFDKKILNLVKEKIEELRPLVLNPEYSEYVSIILDGQLKAASEDNLIFVYNTETESNLFNEQVIKIEEIIKENLNKKYNIISTDMNDWEIIKNEFNSKKTKYTYEEENFKLEDIFKTNFKQDKIEELFGDVVEYK